MKNEMDLLKLDERQRLSWLLANRATLIIVGLVWIALTFYEAAQGRVHWFLIFCVPIFGLIRFGFYRFHLRRG